MREKESSVFDIGGRERKEQCRKMGGNLFVEHQKGRKRKTKEERRRRHSKGPFHISPLPPGGEKKLREKRGKPAEGKNFSAKSNRVAATLRSRGERGGGDLLRKEGGEAFVAKEGSAISQRKRAALSSCSE